MDERRDHQNDERGRRLEGYAFMQMIQSFMSMSQGSAQFCHLTSV